MLRILETLTAPTLDAIDELLMSGRQNTSPEPGLLRLFWLKRVQKRLVLARGIHTTLDTELLHGIDKTKGGRGHFDRADQTGLVRVDLIGRTGDVIGARSTQIGDHRIDLDGRVLAAQATNLVIDVARLNRTAARAVDAQDHTLRIGILEGRTQGAHDVIRTRGFLIGNHSAHVD